MLRRRFLVVYGLSLLALCLLGVSSVATADVPARLSDEAFWQMIIEFSEPSGEFHSDNFTSNESSFQYIIPEMKKSLVPGGVYVGVGPEQNFTYIAKVRPRIAFIVDIRRQAMIQHLMFKAIFRSEERRVGKECRL